MAGARDIRIGVKVDGIDATRQDFKAIGDALNTLGTEGEASAQEISAGFAQIQAASAKVASGIERDGRVSQTALDKLIAEFGRTRDAVDRAFPEGAPDALNTALETAEGRIRSVVAAADNLPTSLEKARNAFRQVESAITETAKAAEPLAHLPIDIGQGFTAAAAAVADFQKKFSETGDVGPGELEKIVKAQERLRIAIERSGKSLDELGPGARQAFDTIDKQAGEATQVVQRLESAVDKNKAALGSMATGWTGLGDAITQSMGRHADVAVQFSIVKAGLDSIRDAIELTEKQMGTAELGGATLSQTFLDLTTSAKDLSVAAQKAGDDILAAGIVFASQPPTVERAKSFVDDYVMSLNKIGVAALAGKEGLTAYQVGLEANLAEQERLNLVYEHGNEVLAFQREAMALGVEGHRVWRTALAESGGTAEGLMGQIERLQPVLKALGDTTDAV
ncbi:MAG: hypothetical protein NDJ92_18325, partial [Thermoanaerobaculia bacterium]|nr:hypothetical protein [Thermoanaerobaculia bacterium]